MLEVKIEQTSVTRCTVTSSTVNVLCKNILIIFAL